MSCWAVPVLHYLHGDISKGDLTLTQEVQGKAPLLVAHVLWLSEALCACGVEYVEMSWDDMCLCSAGPPLVLYLWVI